MVYFSALRLGVDGGSVRDTFNERSIFKLFFYIFFLSSVLYSFITIFMPYYPNSSLSKPLTEFVRTDAMFLSEWSLMSREGAICCTFDDRDTAICKQNGTTIRNPMVEYMDRRMDLGFDLYIVPDMFGGEPSVYLDKNRVDLPVTTVENVLLKTATNINAVRELSKSY